MSTNEFCLDWAQYADTIRKLSAGGCVLLKNDDNALPIRQDEKVSVFGRIQLDYYNAGAGSGGMVNVPYVVSIPQGLRDSGVAKLDEELFSIYEAWEKEHPFDKGHGWATEPFYQEEMPLSAELVKEAAGRSDLAVIVIGRLAGEDRDVELIPGSYYLTDAEEKMLELVTGSFERTVVLLNVGAVMDMGWTQKYNVSAIMYVWQGGLEGGNAVADLLCGKENPSGHLANTIAYKIEDYPAFENYGDSEKNIYAEDIYVGYRYFETAAKDKVLYPFGFGLSYTDFSMELADAGWQEEISPSGASVLTGFDFTVRVKNTGKMAGRALIQIYCRQPQGRLDKPERSLAAFLKTDELKAGESAEYELYIGAADLASYDDGGYTGNRACFVLEKGEYGFFLGDNVRDARQVYSYVLDEDIVVERLQSACMPVEGFERLRYDAVAAGFVKQAVPVRDYDIKDRIESERARLKALMQKEGLQQTDKEEASKDAAGKTAAIQGLRDIKKLEEGQEEALIRFLSGLSDEELVCMTRMEGVYSPRSVDGTVGAFGGISDSLSEKGIPVACCSDGPSGIRRDDGSMAFSLPSGTLLACSFDTRMVEKLYEFEGMELRLNRIDALLGPGINIHRHPLNGRNFEYFSEDPLLTGRMAAAQLRGMAAYGVTGTIKHFCANNQEKNRTRLNSVVSERALREIYLKPFEIAVKEGGAYSVMSTYGALNGTYTAGNFDLITTVLRKQWNYEGVVMTDWWAMIDDELYDGSDDYYVRESGALKASDGKSAEMPEYKDGATMKNAGPMIRAQNDLYSVHKVSEKNTGGDNLKEWLDAGLVKREELIRSACNICCFILKSSILDEEAVITQKNRPAYDEKNKNRRIDAQLQSPPIGNI